MVSNTLIKQKLLMSIKIEQQIFAKAVRDTKLNSKNIFVDFITIKMLYMTSKTLFKI